MHVHHSNHINHKASNIPVITIGYHFGVLNEDSRLHRKPVNYTWQSWAKIKHYSISYFDCVTVFIKDGACVRFLPRTATCVVALVDILLPPRADLAVELHCDLDS